MCIEINDENEPIKSASTLYEERQVKKIKTVHYMLIFIFIFSTKRFNNWFIFYLTHQISIFVRKYRYVYTHIFQVMFIELELK